MVLSKRKSQSSGQLDEENKSLWIEKKIYGAWLGKLIGIRAGAPIENWTSEEIRKTFGKIEGYPVDYDVFAADDDSNGPLYFVRADAPPMLLITGDRELELFGRYEENAYMQRMMKLAGHQQTTLYELQGFDHGGMAEPAFPLLLKEIKRIEKLKEVEVK